MTKRLNACLGILLFACVTWNAGCKKNVAGPIDPLVVIPGPGPDTIPTDPATSSSVGFFMDTWQAKSFTPPTDFTEQTLATSAATATVTINTGQVLAKMPPNYYGNNSNLWIGQINTEATLINHLAAFKPRILRGPAGSVSDVYFFNAEKNTPPAGAPAEIVDADGKTITNPYWYGKNNESWTFSTDGYYDLLQKTNSIGMLTVNYGYARYGTSADPVAAAAHLAANWVRYDRGRTKYWEVGNENFGSWEAGYRINTANNKDGQPQIINGALYGKHFKVFADSMRKAAQETGFPIKIGAVLFDAEPASWETETVKTWNAGVYSGAGSTPDFYSVHSYFTNYMENSNAATVLATATAVPQKIKNYVATGLSNAGLPQKPMALTEWNLFSSGSKQNVSHIAGMHAVLAMSEFIRHGYGASLRWDLGNGWDNGDDHGLFNNGTEPGIEKWNPRPAFYHMYYFQHLTGDRMLQAQVTGTSDIAAVATSFTSGQKGVVLVNKGTAVQTTEIKFQHFTPGTRLYYYVLTGANDNGEFSRMVMVNGKGPANGIAGGPSTDYASLKMYSAGAKNGIKISLPARSVVFMVVDKR